MSNNIRELPPGLFAGLSRLSRLSIGGNDLTTLPDGIFSGLTSLTELDLFRNQLSSLPAGVFSGLTSLEELNLSRNRVDPLPLSISLEKVGNNQFKAVAPTGAPFALPVPVSSVGGTIEGNAGTVTIPAGAVESSPISVARVPGAQRRVTVDIGTLPDLPGMHSGYVFEKGEALPISVLPSVDMADATLSDVSLSDGTLDPVFEPDTTAYTASVPHAVASTTVTPATSNPNAAAAFQDGSDAALLDADANTDGHQVSLSSGDNVIKVAVTAENGTSVLTYTIVMTREASICNRTDKVVDAIVQAVSDVDSCGYVSNAHLAEITTLDLSGQGISSLQSGDFKGLSALQTLQLTVNQLTTLPADIFSGMAALESLELQRNQLESLPENLFFGLSELRLLDLASNRLSSVPDGIFSGLSKLNVIRLGLNRIASLPSNTFSGLSLLTRLALGSNELTNLPADVFADLSALEGLWLYNNALTSLPAGVFSGLSALQELSLRRNRLTALPDGLFAGLTNLRAVRLEGNAVDPLPFSVSLEKVGNNQFKAVAPVGAPFNLAIPVSASSSGAIEGDVEVVTIPIGVVESAPVGISRVPGASEAVTVDIGTLPGLFGRHLGYVLVKDENLPVEILPADMASDVSLQSVVLNDMEIEPTSDEDTTRYRTTVENAVASVTLTVTPNDPQAKLAYFGADDQELADADAGTEGYQADLVVGDNTVKVKVTSPDETATQTYVIVVTRAGAGIICSRTAQVRDAIVAAVTGVSACAEVTETHLAGITTLDLSSQSIASLQSGDFSGLSALETLSLNGNQLTALPDGLFAGLTNLGTLTLGGNTVNPMPLSVSLAKVGENQFKAVAPTGAPFALAVPVSSAGGTIDGSAGTVTIPAGAVESPSVGVSRAPGAIEAVTVDIGTLPALPDAHSGYVLEKDTTLPRVILPATSAAPPAQVTGVVVTPGEDQLDVSWTAVSGAGGYKVQWKSGEEDYAASRQAVITTAATTSHTITGLTAGTEYTVRVVATKENADDGSPSDEVTGTPRAVTPDQVTGLELAAGTIRLVVSWAAVSGAGGYKVQWKSGEEDYAASRQAVITAGATTSHIIPALTAGTEYTVRVIATKEHADDGPASDEVTGIPRAVLPGQVTGLEVSPGEELLDVSWTAVSDAGGYKVQWKSGEEDYEEAHQAVILAGATTNHTITGLTAGTEYTVRVIGTKENANDGPPSDEVTGTPRAVSPGQVTGLEVAAGTNRLVVSWTAVSDAGGYKVQWKSGEEDYEEAHQAVISAGATTNHTITELTAGTEYTVRVIATKEYAEDGPASDEVTGTPQAAAVLSSLSLSNGTLDPVFAPDTTSYTASVPHAVASITVTVTPNISQATLAYFDADDQELADADSGTAGHQADLDVGDNTVKVKVTSQDETATRTYVIVVTRDGTAGVCGRTAQVRDAIVAAITGVSACAEVTEAHLAGIRRLDLSSQSISSLQSGDFSDLPALETLRLNGNQLTALPADVFAGLSSLRSIVLNGNGLTSLPAGVFSGLSALQAIWLHGNALTSLPSSVFSGLSSLQDLLLNTNKLTSLPAGVFSGLSALQAIWLQENELTSLPAGVFSGLSSLEGLYVRNNSLTSLPAGVFSGLSALGELRLDGNKLTTLPDGLFAGLTNLGTLTLGSNTVNPMPLSVSLAKVGENQFRAVAPTGAPFALAVAVSSAGGTIDGGASSVTIPAGAAESPSVGVSRVPGAIEAVTVDIGTLPALPDAHSGYVLEKDTSLPLTVLPSRESADTALSGLSLSHGTLDPVFDPNTTSYTASVPHAVATITLTVTANNSQATLVYFDADDLELADLDSGTAGHQADLDVGQNTIRATVTSQDETATRNYVIVVTRASAVGVCGRTAQVRDAIAAAVTGVSACADVTGSHLADITLLDLGGQGITSLQSGDFAGLSALQTLRLQNNQLTALPADIFSGLAALETLGLENN